MRSARRVLQRLEESLRNAVEGVGHLLPGKLHPLELAGELARAMDRSQSLSAEGTYAANEYRVVVSPRDLELFGGLREELEAELAWELEEHARAAGYMCGPRVRVSLEAGEKVPPGRVRVESRFAGEPVPARLRVIAGLESRSFAIRGDAVLGRSETCMVQLDEPMISREHARLRWTYAGYLLEDLGSSNGTYVGGQQVAEALLQEGDIIELGLVQLQFSYAVD